MDLLVIYTYRDILEGDVVGYAFSPVNEAQSVGSFCDYKVDISLKINVM